MNQIVFTPAALADLLSQIEELSDKEISIVEANNGDITLGVGESTYTIASSSAADVAVPKDVVDEVSNIDDEAYNNLSQMDVDDADTIESGLLRQLVKTLLIGGIVRLGVDTIKK